jgi:cytochrome c oxidase accessory protein FixG
MSAERPGHILDSPEEVLSTLQKDGKRRWMYPAASKGRFYWQRFALGWILIAFFVALPIVKIGGKPAVFLDLAHREFTFFGLTLYATDTIILMIFLLAVLLTVFFVTALFGRVWCGWGCPQTVYLEFVYRPIERLFEGKEYTRKKRDEGPWTPEKTARKIGKWAFYTLFSVFLAHTFVAYFASWDNLLQWMQGSPREHWGYFVVMAFTSALVLFNFGFFREQMCTIACPYARFQSVLMDRDSLIVSYDPNRGEPRGRRTKAQREKEKAHVDINLGDCIDCGACVRTCPTGIDIRDGLQMECIGCTQCIDACDGIMIGVGKPVGLIRYTSENTIDKKPSRVLRPRVILYALLLVGLYGALAVALSSRTDLDVNIGRVAAEPYTIMGEGDVANRLRFRIQNRTTNDTTATIHAIEPAGTEVRVVGLQEIALPGKATQRLETWVVVPAKAFAETDNLEGIFEVRTNDGRTQTLSFTLLGPSQTR